MVRRLLERAFDSRASRVGAAAAVSVIVLGVIAMVALPLLQGDTTSPAVPASTTDPAADPTVAETTGELPAEVPAPAGDVVSDEQAEAADLAPPTTTAAGSDCEGESFREGAFVWDQCVLDALTVRLDDLYSGRHAVRAASIRDGWALASVFEDLAAEGADRFGADEAADPSHYGSLWSDVEGYAHRAVELHGAQWARRDLVNARFRVVFNDGSFVTPWTVASFSLADGLWQVSYTSFCRFLGAARCPEDPRPEVAAATGEAATPVYAPVDDPRPAEDTTEDVAW